MVKNVNTRRILENRKKYFSKNDLYIIAKELSWSTSLYNDFRAFIAHFASIPASEATCERVFAGMRDIISVHQKRYTSLHLREAAILKLTHSGFSF